jgi:hypothetical protein
MAESLNANTTKAVLLLSWLFGALLMWYCAMNTIGGEDNESVRLRYETYLTPEPYAFNMWGLIVFMQGVFVAYYFTRALPEVSRGFITAWTVALVAGAFWGIFFTLRYLTLALALVVVTLMAMIFMYQELVPDAAIGFPEITARYILGRAVVQVQLAWVSVMTVMMAAMAFTQLGWSADAPGAVAVTVVVEIAMAALALVVLYRRRDIVFGAVFVWAFWTIRNHQDQRMVKGTAMAMALLIACAVIVQFFWGLVSDSESYVPQ